MVDEREIERVLMRLERLKAAIIDASSIIYITKSGFFHELSGAIRLSTIPAVVNEVQMPGLEIQVVDSDGTEPDTDRQLVAAAVSMRSPVISEDRAILLSCRKRGIEFYNAYMMLILLRLRRLIEEHAFRQLRPRLIDVAYYGKPVLDYAEAISEYLDKAL